MTNSILVITLICVFLGAVDLTVIGSLLPAMIADLGVNAADIDRYIWAVSGYLIAYVVAIPVIGRVSDRIGRQPALAICLGAFLAGSIVCAAAPTLEQMIAGRTIQGLGGGGLVPLALALMGDVLPKRQYLAGIGIVGAVETSGWFVGPIFGSSVIGVFDSTPESWRWVFWVNGVFIVIALCIVLRMTWSVVDLSHKPGLGGPNVVSVVLLTVLLILVNLGLASGGEAGISSTGGLRALGGTPNPLARFAVMLIALAAIATVLLIAHERRIRKPLLPLQLFSVPAFWASLVGNFFVGSSLMVIMVNIPVVVSLTTGVDHAPTRTALLLAPLMITIAIASTIAGRCVERFGAIATGSLAALLAGSGFIATWFTMRSLEPESIVIPSIAIGTGIGLMLPLLAASGIEHARPGDRGAAASMVIMFRLLGMTIGISLGTSAGVRRLQILADSAGMVVPQSGESTASLLSRQQQFILDHAIPLSLQVVRETFIVAGVIVLFALIPMQYIRRSNTLRSGPDQPDVLTQGLPGRENRRAGDE